MAGYHELIKNFERIRAYMRQFYVYGFKSRDEYRQKSARSYDDERRRIESWLGEHMRFVHTKGGKRVFLSVDSRKVKNNPFYKAWKAKSFTDGDITLHFILFDILHSPDIRMSISQIMTDMDNNYLSLFEKPMLFDESTVRKKLKEYCEEGLVVYERQGKKMLYRRANNPDLKLCPAMVDFFSEAAPLGVVGSFLLDKMPPHENHFVFKHHYITSAMDSEVLAMLFFAMQKKCIITANNCGRGKREAGSVRVIPLRIFISVQTGRQYLMAYSAETNKIQSFRVDYLSHVKLWESSPRFDELRARLDRMQPFMWGVATKGGRWDAPLEHVEFTVKIGDEEAYIVRRLMREKRHGHVEKIDDHTYRFTAELYDSSEILPWIRTFICRIETVHFSNGTVEKQFKKDLDAMYRLYGVDKEE